jgi:hypothetical protein
MIHAYMGHQFEEAMSRAAGVEESNKDRNLKGRETFR